MLYAVGELRAVLWVRGKTVEWIVCIVECTWLGTGTTTSGRERPRKNGSSAKAVDETHACACPSSMGRNECCDVREMVSQILERWVLVGISVLCLECLHGG